MTVLSTKSVLVIVGITIVGLGSSGMSSGLLTAGDEGDVSSEMDLQNDAGAAGEIEIWATTTETNARTHAMVKDHQPIVLHVRYTGLGSGTHQLELIEDDSVFDDEVKTLQIHGDSGHSTYQLSPATLAETKETGAEGAANLFVRWGEDTTSNTFRLWWVETTVYTKGYGRLPSEIPADESITIEYYGWTSEQQTHVRLVEDDPPRGSLGGNDETIRRESVSGPGYFSGTFTFTPGESVGDGEEPDRVIEVQARAANVVHYADLVRELSVGDPKPKIEAQIEVLTPPTGEYYPGERVRTQVEVRNTGNTKHTFFVGYGVIDESGNIYDNDGTTGKPVILDAGEFTTVQVTWTVDPDVPPGQYDIAVAVWEESDPDALETRIDEDRVDDSFVVADQAETTTRRETTTQPTERTTRTKTQTTDSTGTDTEPTETTTEPTETTPQSTTSMASETAQTVPQTTPAGEETGTDDDIEFTVEIPGFSPLVALAAMILVSTIVLRRSQ